MNNKGFTLIELLIVVVLTGLAVGITGDILISVTKSYNRTQVTNEVEQQANFVSSKITKELKDAYTIDTASTNSTQIVLKTKTGTDSVKYYLNTTEGKLYRQVGTTTAVPITSSVTKIEGVRVQCGADGCFKVLSTAPYIVKYSFIFDKGSSATLNSTFTISDTVVLRGAY